MRYAVVSDVHANVEALRRVLADAARCGAARVVCLGDVVGYGPQPAEALALVRRAAAVTLAGNHDDAVSGRGSAEAFCGLAADAVARHREALSSADLAWLRALPYVCELDGGARAAHGDFVDPPKFYYVDDAEGAAANFAATDAQLLFVGHTHVPALAVVGDSGQVHLAPPQDFALEPNKRYVVNPGSVGYPREADGACRSSYVLYDSSARTVEFRFLPFSVASVMPRGKAAGRRRRLLLAGALALSAAALAAALALGTGRRAAAEAAIRTQVVEVEKAEDPALVLARRELTLRPGDRKAVANLTLDPGPAELTVEFRDANGNPVDAPFRRTVRESDRTARKVPAGAVSATFTVRKATRDGAPRIVSFAPAAR